MINKFISYWAIPILMVVLIVTFVSILLIHKDDDKIRPGMVITSIDKGEKGQCKYRVYISGWINSWLVDSCGKFQVGDTIKIVKK